MAEKKTVLVTGATGAQGGSVAKHLLKSGQFDVRCLTRHANSEKASALKQLGAQVVEGDLADAASLKPAMAGCYGVFGVTNFWEHFEKEVEHGRNLINAVADAGVPHFVFSSLPSAERLSKGALPVPHFDQKADLAEYATSRGLKTTFVSVAFYYENFTSFFPPRKLEDGSYAFGFPQGDTPLAAVAAEDTGGVVAPIFERPDEFIGRTVGVVGDDEPPSRYAEVLTRVLGVPVHYNYVPRDVFASFGFPGADDLANMFEFNRLHILERKADLAESRKLYPEMQTFETWAGRNKSALHTAMQLGG